MSSVVFVRPPRFLAVYRRLFGQGGSGGAGFWATTNNDQLDLRMDKLVGCPDEAVLAIAEIAALASWKKSEAAQGRLSIRELIRRCDVIDQNLNQRPARNYAESPVAETALPSGMPTAAGTIYDIAGPNEAQRQAVAKIYRETAMLYLHTVLNGPHPGKSASPHQREVASLTFDFPSQASAKLPTPSTTSSTPSSPSLLATLTARVSSLSSSRGVWHPCPSSVICYGAAAVSTTMRTSAGPLCRPSLSYSACGNAGRLPKPLSRA